MRMRLGCSCRQIIIIIAVWKNYSAWLNRIPLEVAARYDRTTWRRRCSLQGRNTC